MGNFKCSTGLWALRCAADRFLPGGNAEKAATLREVLKKAGSNDGYDYSLQIDYRQHWKTLRESLEEIARYKGDMKICLE
jgi:hypothetical protein